MPEAVTTFPQALDWLATGIRELRRKYANKGDKAVDDVLNNVLSRQPSVNEFCRRLADGTDYDNDPTLQQVLEWAREEPDFPGRKEVAEPEEAVQE
jgi:hypothetical protein